MASYKQNMRKIYLAELRRRRERELERQKLALSRIQQRQRTDEIRNRLALGKAAADRLKKVEEGKTKKAEKEKAERQKKEKELRDFQKSIGNMKPEQVERLLYSIGFDGISAQKNDELLGAIVDPRITEFINGMYAARNETTPENLNDTAYRIASRLFPEHNKLDILGYTNAGKSENLEKFKADNPRMADLFDNIREATENDPAAATRIQQEFSRNPKLLAAFRARSRVVPPQQALAEVMAQWNSQKNPPIPSQPYSGPSALRVGSEANQLDNAFLIPQISTYRSDRDRNVSHYAPTLPVVTHPASRSSENENMERIQQDNAFQIPEAKPERPASPKNWGFGVGIMDALNENDPPRSAPPTPKKQPSPKNWGFGVGIIDALNEDDPPRSAPPTPTKEPVPVRSQPLYGSALNTGRYSTPGLPDETAKLAYDSSFNIPRMTDALPNTVNRILREGAERKKRNDTLFNAEMERLKKENARKFRVPQTDGRPFTTRMEEQVWDRDSPLDRSPALKRIRQAEEQRARLQREAFGTDADYERIRAQTEAAKRDRLDRGRGMYEVARKKWEARNAPRPVMGTFNGIPSQEFGVVSDSPQLFTGIKPESQVRNDPEPREEDYINYAMNLGRTIPNTNPSYEYYSPNAAKLAKREKYFYTEPEFYPELYDPDWAPSRKNRRR